MLIYDRYVLRMFVKVLMVSFLSLTGLFVIIDLFGNLEEFISYADRQGSLLAVLFDYYGARVLSEPPRVGFNWLAYVVPPIVIVAGIFILFRAFRVWSQPTASSPQWATEASADEVEASPTSDDEYIARMEEELKKRN